MSKVKSCPINGFQDCRLEECAWYTQLEDCFGCSQTMTASAINWITTNLDNLESTISAFNEITVRGKPWKEEKND